MKNTLILTGWGWPDYACAAAVALRHWKQADILGMSTRRLPEFLSELPGYKNIVILGIGLTGNPEQLREALAKLAKKGTRVSWISAIPAPEGIFPEKCSNIELFVGDDWLTCVVGECYKQSCTDLLPVLDEKSRNTNAVQYRLLLAAAMYAYRNYQDERSYGAAICHLANRDPESRWSDSDRQLVEHYKRYGDHELVGKSAAMEELREKINIIAPHTEARVLVYGESGTGKETVVEQIHNKSPLRLEPYHAFNCASVTPNLLESRFFGHEKGAFTGATEQHIGLFERSNGGTLFLDEIGELPLEAQGILLRVLESGRFTRVGGTKELETHVRLITATNRDLAAMVREGKFREDLFYRLNVVQLRVPPLREHKSDIEQIANSYWLKRHRRRLEPEQIAVLESYDYPGNVRELRNILERASVLAISDFAKLLAEHKQMMQNLTPQHSEDVPDELEAAIRLHVKHVYEKYNNNLTRAAEALKASRNTVRKYLEEK